MAEEEPTTENSQPQGKKQQSNMRQIRPGKDHAFVINGQQVVLFDAPKKVRAKFEVVLPGYHLSVYDRVYLRAKDSRFSPVNLHRAYADTDPVIFSVPDFDKFLKEGDPVWVELVSTRNSEASGYLFPYIIYSLETEEEEEAKEQGKTQEQKTSQDEKTEESKDVKGLGFAGLAVAAAGEAITGLAGAGGSAGGQGVAADSVRGKLKKALEKRDKKALKEAIDEAKNSHDTEALKEAYKDAIGGYEKSLFEEALGLSDFQPRRVSEEEDSDIPDYEPSEEEEVRVLDSRTKISEAPIDNTSTIGGRSFGESQTGRTEVVSQGSTAQISIHGTTVGSGTVSGRQTVEVARVTKTGSQTGTQTVEVEGETPDVELSGQVQVNNQADVSAGISGGQNTVSKRTISGSTGGGKTGGKVSTISETETQQEIEDNVTARVQGGSGVSVSSAVESSIKANLQETVKGGGGEVEMEEVVSSPVSQGQPVQKTVQRKVTASPGQGGAGHPAGIKVAVSSASPSASTIGATSSFQSNVSGTVQYGVSPISQGATAQARVEVQPGMPGVKIEAASLKVPLKGVFGSTEKPAASVQPETPGQAPTGGRYGLEIDTEQTNQVRAERKPTENLDEEDEILSHISPQAREAALSFNVKASAHAKKMPGVAGPVSKKDQQAKDAEVEYKPGNTTGTQLSQPGEKKVQPKGAGPVQGGVVEDSGDGHSVAEKRLPRGVPGEKVAAGAAEEVSKSVLAGSMAALGSLPNREGAEKPSEQTGGPLEDSKPEGGESEGQPETQPKPDSQNLQDQQAVEEQQNSMNQALSDRLDKLAEDKKLDAEIKKVTQEANLALDEALMEGVAWVWAAAIPSFGLAVLLGAIIGDFLWAFKNSLIEGVLRPLLRTEALRKKAEEIAKQIKISAKVKLNIVAMNLVVVAAIMLVLLAMFLFVWVGCNYPPGLSKISYKLTVIGALGGSSICESLDNMTSNFSFGGGDSGGAGASDSWGSGGLLSTNQWTSQINQAAAQYSVDPCILRVVVQKESGGQANIIGCDCAANGKPQLCPAGARGPYTPSYQFNWDQCSYGIGLTQWTIYQRSSSENWNRWENPSTPSRTVFVGDRYYYVNDFLDPQTSLNLTARAFKNFLNKSGGSVAGAFREYMGNGAPQSWVDQRMALYNMCKSSGGQ